MTSGFPALPMPEIRPPLIPTSALRTPVQSMMSALVITQSSASASETPAAWPIPSRRTLPPPNLHSSPYTVASVSTSATSCVSASRMRSPVVGPKMPA